MIELSLRDTVSHKFNVGDRVVLKYTPPGVKRVPPREIYDLKLGAQGSPMVGVRNVPGGQTFWFYESQVRLAH